MIKPLFLFKGDRISKI